MDVWITVTGKAGHVGDAYASSSNAIEEMAYKIVELRKLTNLDLGLIVSTDIISGGTVSNAVADHCRIEVDCRYDFNADKPCWKKKSRKSVPGPMCPVRLRKCSLCPACRCLKRRRAMSTPGLVNQAAQEFGQPAFGPAHPGGCSDASFMAKAGIPILCSCGVQGDGAHTKHEFANVETMFTRTKLLAAAICKL